MERKFTDDEIVKAVECCYRLGARCVDCPFYGVAGCMSKAGEAFLDFNNRQKAEIERLQTVKKHIQNLILRDCDYPDPESYNNAFKKALERLHNNCNIKSEAIKEFAERVKDIVDEPALIRGRVIDVTIAKIDKLVKEMMGEDNGN